MYRFRVQALGVQVVGLGFKGIWQVVEIMVPFRGPFGIRPGYIRTIDEQGGILFTCPPKWADSINIC